MKTILFSGEPSSVPKIGALQKIRSLGQIESRSGLHDRLSTLMDKNKERQYLRNTLNYQLWKNEQRIFYSNYKLKNYVKVAIDATSDIVDYPFSKSKCSYTKINMYTIHLLREKDTGLPVGTFFSNRQRTCDITYNLSCWLHDFKKKPDEVITDDDIALIQASQASFNGCSLDDYILQCWELITSE